MEIRLAQTRDIPGMIGLLQQVGEVHHTIRPDLFRAGAQKYNEKDLEELLKDPTRPIFVAVEEGRLLGYCFCILEETVGNPVLMDDKTLYIDDLCVDETIRGKHVGRTLYEHTKTYARQTGCRSVTLNVWCGNDSAMAFYEKQGLKPRKIYMEALL
ncbi:MAG: GNAT family N-acetyltransferase [Oscillospiraceae bacterium]|nr:GNAT family N-acetyltransferase [Oscillospiraceae bacterium]